MPNSNTKYDVAITFAGEDRPFAREVCEGLKEAGLHVFFDEDFQVEMWGKNGVDFLEKVYGGEARFALMLISRAYVTKHWTNLERQSAQAQALNSKQEYILPVRLDDSELPGMPSSIFYLDARHLGVEKLVQAVVAKVGIPADAVPPRGVPCTPAEYKDLLTRRPPAWEYRLLAGRLRDAINAHEDAYRDFEIGLSTESGQRVSALETFDFLGDRLRRIELVAEQMEPLLQQASIERAVGAPGEEGDAARIDHLADAVGRLYAQFLAEASVLRSAVMPTAEATRAARIQAEYLAQPVAAVRNFVSSFAQVMEGIEDELEEFSEGDSPVSHEFIVVFEVPQELSERYQAALVTAKQSLEA